MIYLAIIFLLDGEPTQLDGWTPFEQESLESCERRRDQFEHNMESFPLPDNVEIDRIICGTLAEIRAFYPI